MAKKELEKLSHGKTVGLVLLGLIGLGLLIAALMRGNDVALLDPKGFVAQEQHGLMIFSMGLMLAVAIPAVILLYFFAWKFRADNQKATYNPNMRHSKRLLLIMWTIPSVVVVILASVMWPATHKLEPQKTMDSSKEALTIQVAALRWKWLFIYPEQNIASVNFAQIPVDTPVRFELTADDAPKSSFWVPHLGGQLYAMAGHSNPLYLMAEEAGDYPGASAEINGPGFAGMRFTVRASTQAEFDQWVQDVQRLPEVLDEAEYEKLLEPSEKHPVALYSQPVKGLYDKMLMKYSGSHGHYGGHHKEH